MFKRNTVFIIGAGCSAELRLPIGSELLDRIYYTFSDIDPERRDELMDAFIRSGVSGANANVGRRVSNFTAGLSTAPSIDQYLDFHRDDAALVMLGKCAVASEILHAEGASELGERYVTDPLPDVWLRRLLYLMMDATDKSDPSAIFNNVTFITFNYDRTIEVFFKRAIQALVHCSSEETEQILKKLHVWHPYGTVGGSGPAAPGMATPKAAFTERRIQAMDVLVAAKGLRTFTEGAADELERSEMRAVLRGAQQIVFLGFSYLEANMQLLRIGEAGTSADRIFGTVFGVPEPGIEIANRRIMACLGPEREPTRIDHTIKLCPLTAKDFVSQYGQTLRS